jgi:hypothetical protein
VCAKRAKLFNTKIKWEEKINEITRRRRRCQTMKKTWLEWKEWKWTFENL